MSALRSFKEADMKDNIKGTWNLIGTLINNTGTITTPSCADELLINHKVCKDKSLIANKFNEYFTNIDSGLASKIPSVLGDFRKYIYNGMFAKVSFFAQPIYRNFPRPVENC